MPASRSGITFVNAITEDERHNMIDYSYCYNGGGVGLGDLNNDGLTDVVLTGNQVSSRVYLNKGNLTFEDITEKAGLTTQGWCTGVTLADVNADGWLDIYISRAGNYPPEQRRNLLFINSPPAPERGAKPYPGPPQGEGEKTPPSGVGEPDWGAFTEKAAEYGIADTGWSTQSAFFDYDKDGDLDLYVLNATNEDRQPNRIKPKVLDGSSPANDHLYRNDKGKFTEIHKEAGILDDGWGLGISVNDFNNDGWEDLYISNDFLANDLLYLNNRNGTFAEKSKEYLGHTSHFSMGNDAADYNNDGWADIFVADMMPSTHQQRKKMVGVLSNEAFDMVLANGYTPQYMRNTLQLNRGKDASGKLFFSEIGQMAGAYATDWSWSPLLADFDNDGHRDLFVTNGYRHDITDMDFIAYNSMLGQQSNAAAVDQTIRDLARKQPPYHTENRFFRNTGNLQLNDVTGSWSDSLPSFSNGAAYADLDNDGDLDIVTNNIDEPATLYENTSPPGNYLKIRLLQSKTPNAFALGATVKVFAKGRVISQHHHSVTRGYQSSSDYVIHIGLGKVTKVDYVQVTWPDQTHSILQNPQINRTLTFDQMYSLLLVKPLDTVSADSTLFAETPDFIPFLHQEDDYNDFGLEPLLPHRFSREGPYMTTGDVNNDGLEDFFVGGASGHSGIFFVQQRNGRFRQKMLKTQAEKLEEDTGCLLFDADGDKDLDLYVASGGNQFERNSPFYQNRLYLNNGKGDFTLAVNALPKMLTPSSCVKAADYDRDGDLDLFAGGRREILKYGAAGTSYLLANDGKGRFTDVTKIVSSELSKPGMVTDAAWTDIDKNGWPDLLVVGEFMPLTVFKNQSGTFTKTELPHTNGLWNCLTTGDFNNDGRMDFATGNIGLNQGYGITPQTPLRVYVKDFDGNGYTDPLVTYYVNGQETPAASRDELTKQLPALRRKFPDYASYARATLPAIFDAAQLQSAEVQTTTLAESVWAENTGNGNFTIHKLPPEAQMAPVRCWLAEDVNQDGYTDLLGVGNSFAPTVSTGRMDALSGLVLLNTGKGTFASLSLSQSGLRIPGDARRLVRIQSQQPLYVITRNQDSLKTFVWQKSHKSAGQLKQTAKAKAF